VGCLDGFSNNHVSVKMRFFPSILVLLSVALDVSSSPTAGHVLHEKRSSPPPLWVKRSKLDSRTVIPVKIGLNQRNLERAEDFIYDVSHPRSQTYGQHWTAKQIAETFAPRYVESLLFRFIWF
jgi:tripeptidyl-peptidase-1